MFFDKTLSHFENETFALVNINDKVSKQMAKYVSYKVNYPKKKMTIFDPNMLRECSIILINAFYVTSVRINSNFVH